MLFFQDDPILQAVKGGEAPVAELFAFGFEHGVRGNVWQHYLAYLISRAENPLTLALERGERGSLYALGERDFSEFYDLFRADAASLFSEYAPLIVSFSATNAPVRDDRVRALWKKLAAAQDAGEFYAVAAAFLKKRGAGILGAYGAFRLVTEGSAVRLSPIHSPDVKPFSALVGYEEQKERLKQNTRAFLEGRGGLNALLYGDAGTGKSSSVKALLHEYAARGLRIVELEKHQYPALPALVELLERRPFRFILFLDDLSFEDFEVEYKYFKAILEGGLAARAENVLIYATSNRRHLIQERWSDRARAADEDDVHPGDGRQEKLSLSARFGLTIYYPSPDQREYLEIVFALAERHGVALPPEELRREALRFEMRSIGKSGRTAEQFIRSLSGK